MSGYCKITLLLLLFVGIAVSWTTDIKVDGGRNHNLTIGMEKGATDGFDLNFDKVSPPPPPVGFYCFFPIADTMFDIIDALWGDVRAPSAEARWKVKLNRAEKPVGVFVDRIPRIGLLSIEGVEIMRDSLAMTFSSAESVLTIEYRGGFWEEKKNKIEFEMPNNSWVEISIENSAKKTIRKFPKMFLAGGKQAIGWNGEDDEKRPLPAGKYRAIIKPEKSGKKIEVAIEIEEENNNE